MRGTENFPYPDNCTLKNPSCLTKLPVAPLVIYAISKGVFKRKCIMRNTTYGKRTLWGMRLSRHNYLFNSLLVGFDHNFVLVVLHKFPHRTVTNYR